MSQLNDASGHTGNVSVPVNIEECFDAACEVATQAGKV